MKYEDFIIQIGPDRGQGYTVDVLKSPAGEGRGHLRLPPGDGSRVDLTPWARATFDLRDARELDDEDPEEAERPRLSCRQIGDELFRALFTGQVKSLFFHSLGMLEADSDRGLRLKLKLNPRHPEVVRLNSLAWEYLFRAETEDYLSLNRRSPVVRYLDVPRPLRPLPLPKILRVLVVISSPSGHRKLDLPQERREIEAAWKSQKNVDIVFLRRADLESLRRALAEKPIHVLHFMGHGGFEEEEGEGVLYFEDPRGSADAISGRALATELKEHTNLQLVFLNACNTAKATKETGLNPFAGVATALVLGGLPAVVAMQYPISDEAAIAFSREFYRFLARGEPLDSAMVEGRRAIHRQDPRSTEWGTPVLFSRSPEGQIFFPRKRRALVRKALVTAAGSISLAVITTQLPWNFRSTPEPSEKKSSLEPITEDSATKAPLKDSAAKNPSEDEEDSAGGSALKAGPGPADSGEAVKPPPVKEPGRPSATSTSREQEVTSANSPENGTLHVDEKVGLRLRYVRRGEYTIGSPQSELLRHADERQHKVFLNGFWITETEISQELWQKRVKFNPSHFAQYGSDMAQSPVEKVNWYEALRFANLVSEAAGLAPCYQLVGCREGRIVCEQVRFDLRTCEGYRLPTEAEWEVAARARSATPFHTGAFLTTNQANFHGDYPYPGTPKGQTFAGRPVALRAFDPNRFHLYAMHGNVREWVWDVYAPYRGQMETDPTGPPSGPKRVVRGGSYHDPAKLCRSAVRQGETPDTQSKEIGFRLARTKIR